MTPLSEGNHHMVPGVLLSTWEAGWLPWLQALLEVLEVEAEAVPLVLVLELELDRVL